MKDRHLASLDEAYEVGKLLGKGGFAEVLLGKNKETGQEVALKTINLHVFHQNETETLREVDVMSQLDHVGIVKVHEVVRTPTHFVIVMELLRGGELFDRIVARHNYSEQDARVCCRQLLEAIEYMHDHNVVHRDLKPENIIYEDESSESPFKLTDFGFAEVMRDKKLTASCGTPEYVAPEILLGRPYNQAVDMWSFGVITYILLCGYPPFCADDGTDESLYRLIERCSWDSTFSEPDSGWEEVSETAKDFIRKLLVKSQRDRLTAKQALEHPWLDISVTNDGLLQRLTKVQVSLQAYQATRKFREGILTVVAGNRLRRLLELANANS
eukprot:c33142_g1_i1.p1 GENE.c33142_g1_i1~~c33142_g1_i1.p1  ORF type:complete len:328 (-),score=64.19 c33142_g1_i1:53-1036(-)